MGRRHSQGVKSLQPPDTDVLKHRLQEAFAMRRAIDSRSGDAEFKSLSDWVDAIAIPYFHSQRRQTTPVEDQQIRQWYRNQCRTNGVSIPRVPVQEDPRQRKLVIETSRRLPCLRDAAVDEFGEEISRSLKEVNGITSRNFFNHWNRALTEKIDGLTQDERTALHAKLDAELIKRGRTPTKEEILALQSELSDKAADAVHDLLGWNRRQHGDAVGFLTIAYRDSSNIIREKNHLISNELEYAARCKHFEDRYNDLMSGHLAAVADIALPKHELPLNDPVNGSDTTSPDRPRSTPSTMMGSTSPEEADHPLPQEVQSSSLRPGGSDEHSPAPVLESVSNILNSSSPHASPLPRGHQAATPYQGDQPVTSLETPPPSVVSPRLLPTSPDVSGSLPPGASSAMSGRDPSPAVTSPVALPLALLNSTESSNREASLAMPLEVVCSQPDPLRVQALPHSPPKMSSLPESVDPRMIVNEEPDEMPVVARKPRQKQRKHESQPVRASTRNTKVPKPIQPLSDKNQIPRKKVLARNRWEWAPEPQEDDGILQAPSKRLCRR